VRYGAFFADFFVLSEAKRLIRVGFVGSFHLARNSVTFNTTRWNSRGFVIDEITNNSFWELGDVAY
jgi:hypothetical protein